MKTENEKEDEKKEEIKDEKKEEIKDEEKEEIKEEKKEENKGEIKEEIDNLNAEEEAYEKLKNSKFKQQNLSGWKPEFSNNTIILIFIGFGIVFIFIGTILLVASQNLVEIKFRYDEKCKINESCEISIKIKKTMKRPIMVYYQLDGIYQNHRRYLNSKSDDQLHGKKMTLEEMKNSQDCEPVVTNEQMGKTISVEGHLLKKGDLAIPCGLIARSFFNDTYFDWTIDGVRFVPNENNISWETDRRLKYRNVANENKKQWHNMTDEHFIVWMRPAALPNFKKLWARIEDKDLIENQELKLTVNNTYNVKKFEGKKYLVLRTVNAFGGKNNKMGLSYIFIGILFIVLGIVFFFGNNIYKNKHK